MGKTSDGTGTIRGPGDGVPDPMDEADVMSTWWRAVLSYPPSWLVGGIVVAGEAAAFSWFRPSWLGALGFLSVGTISLASWPVVLSATGTVARITQGEARGLIESRLAGLAAELSRLPDPRPAGQLRAIDEKRRGLLEVLGRRLDAGEMTYGRYAASVNQVYEGVLSNLEEVALSMKGLEAMDGDYIERRLLELDAAGGEDGSGGGERASLEERRALLTGQTRKVAQLLAQNESAMTIIDRTTAALADTPIGRPDADPEEAMAALEELARRTGRYATE